MDAVTYPNEKLADFINNTVVPLKIQVDSKLAGRFEVKWTPSLLILDGEGKEHYRTTGFMAAEELIPSILLGIGNAHFNRDEFADALAAYEQVLTKHGASDAAPEAMFQRGVAGYKSTHDPKPLKAAYEQLTKKYPKSEWAKRAQPYRLIP
ncbi:MAG: tetratricopeptide repeat protein [Proteobacteria bacterium]|nr:tetratricopeptide repeat protein [Pseudomonadota bacterium]MBU1737443.1 tetratricopeptide repeat protein [Pseudomonadota bacterium]